jgi:hypothetical protein
MMGQSLDQQITDAMANKVVGRTTEIDQGSVGRATLIRWTGESSCTAGLGLLRWTARGRLPSFTTRR